MSNDPFRRSSQPTPIQNDPRYDVGARANDTFDHANEVARAKDYASDVSTTPAAARLGPVDDADPFVPTGRSTTPPANDPLFDDPMLVDKTPAVADERPTSASANSDVAFTGRDVSTYESVRTRLEQIGAQNMTTEPDEISGKTVFRCEVPYPTNPSIVRVFEAASSDEQKAMLAVTESAEKWVSNEARSPLR